MPKGPKGEKRPADVNARAVMIAKIATGEIEDTKSDVSARDLMKVRWWLPPSLVAKSCAIVPIRQQLTPMVILMRCRYGSGRALASCRRCSQPGTLCVRLLTKRD